MFPDKERLDTKNDLSEQVFIAYGLRDSIQVGHRFVLFSHREAELSQTKSKTSCLADEK